MSTLSKSFHPSYHLRPNKAVDRLLFLEIMKACDLYQSLDTHTYVGFAGPFLEDLRLVAQHFPKLKMISIEEDRETHKRQRFHKCSRRMILEAGRFDQFLARGFPAGLTIVWPDYTDMTRQCLLEISDLARRSVPSSLLRITVRAETPVYKELGLSRHPTELPWSKQEEFRAFAAAFKQAYMIEGVAYDDSLFQWTNFTEAKYPELLARMLQSVIDAACAHPKQFLPLHCTKYSDGTIMLSLTGTFCTADKRNAMETHFAQEGFPIKTPLAVEVIDVPVLTTKERLSLEAYLPTHDSSGQSCLKSLGYLIEGDNSGTLSLYKMQQYEKYYRFYPFFGKLSL